MSSSPIATAWAEKLFKLDLNDRQGPYCNCASLQSADLSAVFGAPQRAGEGRGRDQSALPTLRQVDESTCQGRAEKFRIFPKMETRRVHPIGSLEEFEFLRCRRI